MLRSEITNSRDTATKKEKGDNSPRKVERRCSKETHVLRTQAAERKIGNAESKD